MSESNGQRDAHVQVLTAEVRTLVVGSRQVTLSVAKQLDEVTPEEIEPFGRIRMGSAGLPFGAAGRIEVIGSAGGTLARAAMIRERYLCQDWRCHFHEMAHVEYRRQSAIAMQCTEHRRPNSAPDAHLWLATDPEWDEWERLPLIVLAGLR